MRVAVSRRCLPLSASIALALLLGVTTDAFAVDRTWTGAVDASWSTPGNWSPSGVPGAADTAIFDGTSAIPATIDSAADVAKLRILSSYTGAVSLGANTISIATEFTVETASGFDAGTGLVRSTGAIIVDCAGPLMDFEVAGGILNLAADLAVDGDLTVTSLSYLEAGGQLLVAGDIATTDTSVGTIGGNIILVGASDQSLSGGGALPGLNVQKPVGDVILLSPIAVSNANGTTVFTGDGNANIVSPAGDCLAFERPTVTTFLGTINCLVLDMSSFNLTVTNSLRVLGDLTVETIARIDGGAAIAVSGDMVTNDPLWDSSALTAIRLEGSGDQTISGAGSLPYLILDKPGGDVLLAEDIELYNPGGQATLIGTVTDHIVGRLSLVSSQASLNFLGVIDALDIDVANLVVYLPTDVNIAVELHVQALHSIRSGGDLRVGGNIVTDDVSWGANNSSAVVLTAATDQTVSGAGSLPNLVLEKAGGNVLLAGDIELGNVGGGEATLIGTVTDHIVGRLSLVSSTASLNFLGVIDALDIDVANLVVYLPTDVNIAVELHVQSLHSIRSGGALRVGGDVVTDDVSWGAYNDSAVVLTAAADQTISGPGALPYLVLEKPGGDVVLAEDIELSNFAGNATLIGAVTDHIVGRLSLLGSNASLNFLGVVDALDIDVQNFVVYLPADVNIAVELHVQSLHSLRSGGALRVGGDVVTDDVSWGAYNDSAVVLTAATDQTISGAGTLPYLVLEKAGGDVLLAEDIELNNFADNATLIGTTTDHIVGRLALVNSNASLNFLGVIDALDIDIQNFVVYLPTDVNITGDLRLLSLNSIRSGGSFRVVGDVTSNVAVFTGDIVRLTGAGDQQLLGTGVLHDLDIAKSGGDVLLGTFTTFSTVTVTAGQWDVLGETVTATFSATGGTITGDGTLVGDVTINAGGGLAPGAPVGTLNIDGNLVMAPGATLDVDINGATAGTEHDQVVVTGTVNIDDAALTGTASAQPASPLVIVANDVTDPITGAGISGVAEGGAVTLSSRMFQLTYVGGDGNDLVLQPDPCGNGTLDGVEECDDGNTVDGDCCDASCQFETDGTACEGDTDGAECAPGTIPSDVPLIQSLVGNGSGYNGEGLSAADTGISQAFGGLTRDSLGRLYFTDFTAQRIRRVELDGTVHTIAGGAAGFSPDGTSALGASLQYVFGLALDADDTLYFTDGYNHRIRKVDPATGTLVTVAGGGSLAPALADGGPATDAQLRYPAGISFDSHGDLYFSDRHNASIRKLVIATGIITTVVGSGQPATAFVPGQPPLGTALGEINIVVFDDDDTMYIAGSSTRTLRIDTGPGGSATGTVTVVAGVDTLGFSGDGGLAVDAEFQDYISGITLDDASNVFISDYRNNRIRRVDALTGIVKTVVGTGAATYNGDGLAALDASINRPANLFFDDAGRLVFMDSENGRIRHFPVPCIVTPDPECSAPDTCDGAGVCLRNDVASGTNCGDSGTDCVVQDACDDFGRCLDNGFAVVDTPCGDPADSQCSDPDTCDDVGACLTNDETENADSDSALDCEDGCPLDGDKVEPGLCGCGFPDDFNECTEGTAGCSVNATCSDLACSFECACDAGFDGDGFTCTQAEYCSTVTPICAAIEDGGAGGAVFWGVLEQGNGSLRGFRCITLEPGATPTCDTEPGTTTLQTFDPMCAE